MIWKVNLVVDIKFDQTKSLPAQIVKIFFAESKENVREIVDKATAGLASNAFDDLKDLRCHRSPLITTMCRRGSRLAFLKH